MKYPIEKGLLGTVSWLPEEGDKYLVTGLDRQGKRFSLRSDSWAYAKGINVWKGTRWLIRDGKRYKLCSITN